MFTEWVKAEYSKEISTATGNRWLCELGFKRIHHQKGVYFDGYEWKVVIEDREKYLNILAELDKITICKSNPNPLLVNGQKPLIRDVHDESTFYATCDQSYFWADEHNSVIKKKSLGQ